MSVVPPLDQIRIDSLPVRFESEPDADGVKTVTEFHRNENGSVLRSVSKIRVHTRTVKVPKAVLARRKLAKFGDATRPAEEERKTLSNGEPQTLSLEPKQKLVQTKKEDKPGAAGGKNSIIVCRICGMQGDHWSLKCPYKDKIPEMGAAGGAGGGAEGRDGGRDDRKDDGGRRGGDDREGREPGKYVPPAARAGGDRSGSSMGGERGGSGGGGGGFKDRERDDSTTVRVTNLSEDTTEDQLRDLFGRFGHISRISLPTYPSGNIKGFSFINFYSKQDAAAAISKLNGTGFNHTRISVEWSKPEENGPASPGLGARGSGGGGYGGRRN